VKTDKEVVLEAARLLREQGWGKGAYYNADTNCFCAVGALRQAVGWRVDNEEAYQKASKALRFEAYRLDYALGAFLGTFLGRPFMSLLSWNDLPETTAEDVISLFKRFAEEASGV
jgi:hypothetical protein